MAEQTENIVGMRKKIKAQAEHVRRLEQRIRELKQPEQSGLVEALPEQTLFNAIAAAIKSIPGTSHISINVEAFRSALAAQGGE